MNKEQQNTITEKIIDDPRGSIKEISRPLTDNNISHHNETINPKSLKAKSSFSIFNVFKLVKAIGCWIPLILFIIIVLIIIARPISIWSHVSDFFNADINIPANLDLSIEDARDQINKQLMNVGKNEVIINESQLLSLSKKSFPQLNDLKVDIRENLIKFIWELENSIPDKPIYGVFELSLNEDNKLDIKKIGTERVAIPSALNKLLTDSLESIKSLQGGDSSNDLIYSFIQLDSKVKIESVKIQDDNLILTVNLEASIF